jgi:hypothetical protein
MILSIPRSGGSALFQIETGAARHRDTQREIISCAHAMRGQDTMECAGASALR